jgi:hypothetical protein
MSVQFCIPVIPSADLEKTLRLWVEGLGFDMSSEMRRDNQLIFCMLRKDALCFMLNRRAGKPLKPDDYEGIRLYWTPQDIQKTREHLKSLGTTAKANFFSSMMTVFRTASVSRLQPRDSQNNCGEPIHFAGLSGWQSAKRKKLV